MPDKPQLCTVVGGKQTGKVQAVQEGASHKDPGLLASPKPLKPRAVLCFLSISHCPLSTVVGEGEREVIAVPRRGVAGRAAGGKSTLQGQLVHCELVGVD